MFTTIADLMIESRKVLMVTWNWVFLITEFASQRSGASAWFAKTQNRIWNVNYMMKSFNIMKTSSAPVRVLVANDHEIESKFFQEIKRTIMRSKVLFFMRLKVSIIFGNFDREIETSIMRSKVDPLGLPIQKNA